MKKFAFFVLALICTLLSWVGPAMVQYANDTNNPTYLFVGLFILLFTSVCTQMGYMRLIEDLDETV